LKIPRFSRSTWIGFALAALAFAVAVALLLADKPWEVLAQHGPPRKIKHFVAVFGWWAAAGNAVILLLLAGTVRWWMQPAPVSVAPWLPRTDAPRGFWPLVALAMAVTVVFGLLRIGQSVWDDEDRSVREFIVGEYRLDASHHPKFKDATWNDAFWRYRVPTNHHLQTLLSKASHSVWKILAHPSRHHFSEPVLRWHILVAAAASVGLLALLLHTIGLTRAGIVAAFLLAFHPWHIRYAIELRGYMYTMLCGPLMVLCLLRAIETGRWRWWLGFAAAECALLYAYPGTLYMLVAANLGGLVALWFRHAPADRRRALPRLVVSSALAGMVWIQLMAPNIPQLAGYLKTASSLGVLNARWHLNVASHFLTGLPWNNSDNATLGYPEMLWISGNHPVITALLFGLPAIVLAIGIARLLGRRPAGWLLVAILILPAFGVYVLARKNNNYLYEWYLIFALPGVCAAAAAAADWLTSPLHARPFARPAVLAGFIAVFALVTQPARAWLVSRPLQPIRDVVLRIRPSLDPADPRQAGILTAALYVHLESYDAHARSAQDIPTVRALAREADASAKPFYVVTGNDLAIAYENPELRLFLQDPRYFELVERIRGFHPTLTQTIWRYRPGTLAGDP
jgi:hypothetical protein